MYLKVLGLAGFTVALLIFGSIIYFGFPVLEISIETESQTIVKITVFEDGEEIVKGKYNLVDYRKTGFITIGTGLLEDSLDDLIMKSEFKGIVEAEGIEIITVATEEGTDSYLLYTLRIIESFTEGYEPGDTLKALTMIAGYEITGDEVVINIFEGAPYLEPGKPYLVFLFGDTGTDQLASQNPLAGKYLYLTVYTYEIDEGEVKPIIFGIPDYDLRTIEDVMEKLA